ncbi:hypothetical protein GCM10010508_17070 [Streptomyces naganishii JCM 4654]|uniref:Uncharacterized protein n=1 Tax=Streptomyces naganishii JCM 4654 TaxID=1306179 RepID=A0A918Y2H1_9ACTN|nr:hypothetical protein GCM10010508_17070 [Streptomyces naganishii JCM 4654]
MGGERLARRVQMSGWDLQPQVGVDGRPEQSRVDDGMGAEHAAVGEVAQAPPDGAFRGAGALGQRGVRQAGVFGEQREQPLRAPTTRRSRSSSTMPESLSGRS